MFNILYFAHVFLLIRVFIPRFQVPRDAASVSCLVLVQKIIRYVFHYDFFYYSENEPFYGWFSIILIHRLYCLLSCRVGDNSSPNIRAGVLQIPEKLNFWFKCDSLPIHLVLVLRLKTTVKCQQIPLTNHSLQQYHGILNVIRLTYSI